jgi:hypothetical protein
MSPHQTAVCALLAAAPSAPSSSDGDARYGPTSQYLLRGKRTTEKEAVSSSAARPRPISISPTFTGQRRRTLASPAAVTLWSPWLAEASLSLPSPALTLPWHPALPRTANLTPWSTVTCPRPGAGDRSHGPLAPEQGISNLMASC